MFYDFCKQSVQPSEVQLQCLFDWEAQNP